VQGREGPRCSGVSANGLQGRGERVGWLPGLVLKALPAGGCGRDKFDAGATAP
jgi:hypothetical protein